MDQSPPPVPQNQQTSSVLGENARTSQCAIWSLVLGLLSFGIWLLGSIPAIILGIVAIRNVNEAPANLKGKGLAVTGIVLGSVGIIVGFIVFLAAMSFPAYQGIHQRARETMDINQIRQVSIACRFYASDNDGNYPDALEDLLPDYIEDLTILSIAQSVDGLPQPYSYRSGLKDSSDSNEPHIISPFTYSRGSTPVGFADGQVKSVRGTELEEIRAKFK